MRIVIVGSGIAGMSAAIEAASLGCQVTMISPYPSERAQSVMAAGGINAVMDSSNGDSIASHAEDTYQAGCCIEDLDSIKKLCEAAPGHLEWLEQIGVVFTRDRDGKIRQRAFGGQSHIRTAFAGASTGKQIVTALVQKCRELEIEGSVERVTGYNFHSALIKDGTCYGVLMSDIWTDELRPFYADSVVMAVGGQNKLLGKTTGSEICDGYAAARLFTQGVALRNLEFIQYHPTTVETAHKRMLISEAARGEGGRLYYIKDGERCYFMEEQYGPNGNLMPRDIVSRCIYNCPSQVYLDIAFLGEELIHERLEEIYELCMEYINLDVTKESIPVYPSVHFFMGGIEVDDNHQTNIKNLYAAGECASKYHGANRLGGNSLLAAVHSGRTAAMTIAEAGEQSDEVDWGEYIEAECEELENLRNSNSRFPSAYILKDLATIMNEDLGIVREAEGMEAGLQSIDFYLDTSSKLTFDRAMSLYENYRLKYMIILAKAIMMSAYERKESRGAHAREDYPESREEFRCPSHAAYNDGRIEITYGKEPGKEALNESQN